MKRLATIAACFFCILVFVNCENGYRQQEPSEVSLTPSDIRGFKTQLRPLLATHCFGCHGKKKQKGDLALNKLDPDLVHGKDTEQWKTVLNQLNSGKMPPEKKPRPPAPELLAAVDWLTAELGKAEAVANAKGSGIVLRRLNRLEYRNTMRDLIGHPFDPTELFTPDTVSHGFDNIGEALVFSPLHIETYVAATERILDKVINIPEAPPRRQHWRILSGPDILESFLRYPCASRREPLKAYAIESRRCRNL